MSAKTGVAPTRATALAVRAFAHVAYASADGLVVSEVRQARAAAKPVPVVFRCNGQVVQGLVGGRRARPWILSRRMPAMKTSRHSNATAKWWSPSA